MIWLFLVYGAPPHCEEVGHVSAGASSLLLLTGETLLEAAEPSLGAIPLCRRLHCVGCAPPNNHAAEAQLRDCIQSQLESDTGSAGPTTHLEADA